MSDQGHHQASKSRLYGWMGEFEDEPQFVHAIREVKKAGYQKFEVYTPSPYEGVLEAVGHRKTYVPLACLMGGIVGGITGYALQYYCAALGYPLNIGGRPLNDIPTFIPVIFELTVLFAALSAVGTMILLNGLPRPYHPVFNVERFREASRDGFFLVLATEDAKFDEHQSKEFLEKLKPRGVYAVEP